MSRDSNVRVYAASTIGSIARLVAASLITIVVLVPVIVVSALKSMTAKAIIVFVSCALFVVCLPGLTKATTKETVVAGST